MSVLICAPSRCTRRGTTRHDRSRLDRLATHFATAVDVDQEARAQQHRERRVAPVVLVDQRVLGPVGPVAFDRDHALKRCMISLMPGGIGCRNSGASTDTLRPSSRTRSPLPRWRPSCCPSRRPAGRLPIAEYRRRLQRLLQRRELEAARMHALLVDFRVVGDAARAIVREARERVHAVRLAGPNRRDRPGVASQS